MSKDNGDTGSNGLQKQKDVVLVLLDEGHCQAKKGVAFAHQVHGNAYLQQLRVKNQQQYKKGKKCDNSLSYYWIVIKCSVNYYEEK